VVEVADEQYRGGSSPLTEEELLAAVAAHRQYGSERAAAKAMGLPRTTFKRRLARAAERGLLDFEPVLPGFQLSKTTTVYDKEGEVVREFVQQKPERGENFAVPNGHVVKGVSAFVDGDGREIAKWIKTREGAIDPTQVVEWIKEAFTDFQPAAVPVDPPAEAAEDLLTLIPLADWHLGMYAWHEETGENWDLKIAERVIGRAIESVVMRSKPSGTAVVLGLGDLLHSDTNKNVTALSNNPLQVDGRYQKVVLAACRLVERTVDVARRRHERVVVRILPGNHDEHACIAVAYFLLALYRNEPRVSVDIDPSLFWWFRFGEVMLGATHGHTVRMNETPQIMAHRRAEDWGKTKFRYIHGGHLHHKEKTAAEGGGCITEIHQAPVPQDAWHFGKGFLSGRSVQAITYHRAFGEHDRVRETILEGATV
jgi:predicted phosphodiesterase